MSSEGESLWLAGAAIPTDEGCLSLSMGEGHSVIFSESSIMEVKKDRGLYPVRVKAGSSALIRQEAAVTLRGQTCGCNKNGEDTLARNNTDAGLAGDRVGPAMVCYQFCEFDQECFPYWDEKIVIAKYALRCCIADRSVHIDKVSGNSPRAIIQTYGPVSRDAL